MCLQALYLPIFSNTEVWQNTHMYPHIPPSSSSKVQATSWVDIRPRSFDFQLMGVLSGPTTKSPLETNRCSPHPTSPKKKPPLPGRKFKKEPSKRLIFRVFSCWFQNSGIRNALQATLKLRICSGKHWRKPGDPNCHYGLPKTGKQQISKLQSHKNVPFFFPVLHAPPNMNPRLPEDVSSTLRIWKSYHDSRLF